MGLTQKAQYFRKLSEQGGQDGGSCGCIRTERGLRVDRLVVNCIGRCVSCGRGIIHSTHLRVEPDPGPLSTVVISHEIISSV